MNIVPNISLLNLKLLKLNQSMIHVCWGYFRLTLIHSRCNYSTNKVHNSPKALFKYLIRQCDKLPEDPKKYYKFMIKQSFKQHLNEADPARIKQIIARSYEDADWVLKKYLEKKK